MTRDQVIATINAKLATLDDARLQAVLEIVHASQDEAAPLRQLSARERTLLAQSKADFAAGRSYAHDEMVAMMDERLESLGVPKSAT